MNTVTNPPAIVCGLPCTSFLGTYCCMQKLSDFCMWVCSPYRLVVVGLSVVSASGPAVVSYTAESKATADLWFGDTQ